MSPGRLFLALVLAVGLLGRPAAADPAAFSDWAAVFVAGDYHAHSGATSEVFDNARRDAASAFVRAGFSPAHIRQFSVRPERYPDQKPLRADFRSVKDELRRLAAQARGGCLVYLTSHGSPEGFLLGERLLGPQALANVVGDACGTRPTVVVVSACYSGVFAPALSAPNRMVMTAARPDRSSFGCTEDDKYPYFDACLLQTLPKAGDFADLARRTRACVDARETAEKLTPASEPQTRIGGALAPLLPLYPLNPGV